jgi:hypothetical protein
MERQFTEETATFELSEGGPLNGEDILGHSQVNIFCRYIRGPAATAIRNTLWEKCHLSS